MNSFWLYSTPVMKTICWAKMMMLMMLPEMGLLSEMHHRSAPATSTAVNYIERQWSLWWTACNRQAPVQLKNYLSGSQINSNYESVLALKCWLERGAGAADERKITPESLWVQEAPSIFITMTPNLVWYNLRVPTLVIFRFTLFVLLVYFQR